MIANEKDRAIKNKWTDIVMRIQHKSGGITFDSDYATAVNIFWDKPLPITDSDYKFLEAAIERREQHLLSL